MPTTSKAIPIINNPVANCQCIILNKAPKIVTANPNKNVTNGILYSLIMLISLLLQQLLLILIEDNLLYAFLILENLH